MPPVIDFAKLSLQDALDLAILIEDEARERYEEFAHQLGAHHTPEAASFFRMMAANETKHGENLQLRRQDLFGAAPTRVTPSMLWDVEAPDYDQSRMFMSARQAMDVALQCEIKAHDFFDDALKHVANADVKLLFSELRDEEKEHQMLVKQVMAKLPPSTSVITHDDFADDPVGH
jgi:rubrerythrin